MRKGLIEGIGCFMFGAVIALMFIAIILVKDQESEDVPKYEPTPEVIEKEEPTISVTDKVVTKEPIKPIEVIEEVEDPIEEIIEEEIIDKEYLSVFTVTAYCSCQKCCGQWSLNRPVDEFGNEIVYGALGTVLEAGKSVAVDPDVIPLGSAIEINGVTYIAEDTGVKGNHIDLYYNSHEDALIWGVQELEVYLIHN